jgi:hypothetical protein
MRFVKSIWVLRDLPQRVYYNSEGDDTGVRERYYPHQDPEGNRYFKAKLTIRDDMDCPPAVRTDIEGEKVSILERANGLRYVIEMDYKELNAKIDEAYKDLEIRNNN